MSFRWPKPGLNHAPSYQQSGIPYVTRSAHAEVPGADTNSASTAPVHIKFPYVTKFITIHNTGGNGLRVGFTQAGCYRTGERLPDNTPYDNFTENHFVIPSSASANLGTHGMQIQTFEVRCKEIFFVSDASGATPDSDQATSFTLLAGLTTIPADNFPILTGAIGGSVAFEGVG